jgi:hypothetical protein
MIKYGGPWAFSVYILPPCAHLSHPWKIKVIAKGFRIVTNRMTSEFLKIKGKAKNSSPAVTLRPR